MFIEVNHYDKDIEIVYCDNVVINLFDKGEVEKLLDGLSIAVKMLSEPRKIELGTKL